jgi:hypothetical protein
MFTRRFIFIFGLLLCLVYIATAGFAVVHGVAMSKGGHLPSCPHENGVQALCDTFASGINLWQEGVASSILVLSLFFVAIGLPVQFHRFFLAVQKYSAREFSTIQRPLFYQELFSSGILNPKAP